MSHRSFFQAVRQRPALYGIDGTRGAVTAFVLGFDAATTGGLLAGFREWLIVRIDDGNNLAWPALVERQLAQRCARQGRPEGDAGYGEQGGAELFDLLDEFLSEKEKPHGMAMIFDAYLEWLKRQEWYRSDMLR